MVFLSFTARSRDWAFFRDRLSTVVAETPVLFFPLEDIDDAVDMWPCICAWGCAWAYGIDPTICGTAADAPAPFLPPLVLA